MPPQSISKYNHDVGLNKAVDALDYHIAELEAFILFTGNSKRQQLLADLQKLPRFDYPQLSGWHMDATRSEQLLYFGRLKSYYISLVNFLIETIPLPLAQIPKSILKILRLNHKLAVPKIEQKIQGAIESTDDLFAPAPQQLNQVPPIDRHKQMVQTRAMTMYLPDIETLSKFPGGLLPSFKLLLTLVEKSQLPNMAMDESMAKFCLEGPEKSLELDADLVKRFARLYGHSLFFVKALEVVSKTAKRVIPSESEEDESDSSAESSSDSESESESEFESESDSGEE